MKFCKRVLFFIISLICITLVSITAANLGYFNNSLPVILQYYFLLKGYKAEIHDLDFQQGNCIINQIRLSNKNQILKFEDIKAQFDFDIYPMKFDIQIVVGDANISNIEKDLIYASNLQINYHYEPFNGLLNYKIDIDNFNLPTIKTFNGNTAIEYEKFAKREFASGKVQINDDANIKFKYDSHKQQETESWLAAQNIPVPLFEVLYSLYPENELTYFLATSFFKGIITEANYKIAIKNGVLDHTSLTGTMAAKNLEYIYDYNLPPVTNMEFVSSTQGAITDFNLSFAEIADFQVKDCKIQMDLTTPKKEIITVRGMANGPVNGLIKFIDTATIAKLQQSKIDLTKFIGAAKVDITIDIPLAKGTFNHYDIKADIPNTGLKIFDNKIALHNTNLQAQFTEEKLSVNGKSLINTYPSLIDFEYKFLDQSEYDYKLLISTNIKKNPKLTQQKIGFISLLDGNCKLDFMHYYKNNKGLFQIDANLKNIDLYFDKLGIHKKKGEAATFSSFGNLISDKNYEFKFDLSGENKLKISGNILVQDDVSQINVPVIRHHATDISARLDFKNKLLVTNIKGENLDLTNSDMFNFLEKEIEANKINTKLVAKINSINLRQGINLENLDLNINCDKTKCFDGKITSKIGNKSIDMQLTAENDRENWVINVGNAGGLFKGIGAYDSMRFGNLTLKINTSRKTIKPGEILPIHEGHFVLEKFALNNNSVISRLVSFVSLPGFINMITNNKEIIFSKMTGDFSLDNGILSIKNTLAEGPFFNFSMIGNIYINQRNIDISGYVTPSLYGFSWIVKNIPLFGNMLTVNKHNRGLISAPYKIKQEY